MGNLEALKPAVERKAPGQFPDYGPDHLPSVVTYLPKLSDQERGDAFAATSRTTRSVILRVEPDESERVLRRFCARSPTPAPFAIKIIQTENERSAFLHSENEPMATFLQSNNGEEFTGRVFTETDENQTSTQEFEELF